MLQAGLRTRAKVVKLNGVHEPAAQPPETELLLVRLLKDDEEAWRSVVAHYSGFLLAVAEKTFRRYGFQAAPQDAEDAAAEVWRNLLADDRRLVRNCIERGNFLQTIQVLARNRSVDIMRKRGGQFVELRDEHSDLPAAQGEAGIEIEAARLTAAVEKLPNRERTLVKLFFLQGRKYHEISRLTGIPMGSIGPTLARAVQKLRAAIGLPEIGE
jgi:RNA polymerase sigma-70 factor (ECF subfamily)